MVTPYLPSHIVFILCMFSLLRIPNKDGALKQLCPAIILPFWFCMFIWIINFQPFTYTQSSTTQRDIKLYIILFSLINIYPYMSYDVIKQIYLPTNSDRGYCIKYSINKNDWPKVIFIAGLQKEVGTRNYPIVRIWLLHVDDFFNRLFLHS